MGDPVGAVYNRMPPNKRSEYWTQIKDVKAPFHSTDAKTFGYWFNYLWEEARQSAHSSPEQAKLGQAFSSVLVQQSGAYAPAPALTALTNPEKLQVLTWLLDVGFQRILLDKTYNFNGASVQEEQAISGAGVFASHMKYAATPGGDEHAVNLGFRADGRDYATLVSQGGFSARARAIGQSVHADYGLNQPWNPLSQSANSRSLFLRKGINKDNCLHTVVSVSMELSEILPYPLLSDPTLFEWGTTPFDKWTPDIIQKAEAHRYNVTVKRLTPNGPIDHVESKLRVFVLRMNDSKAFSTKDWQKKVGVENPFPEAAVDQVKKEDILAEVTLTRWHFFAQDFATKLGDLQLYAIEFDDAQALFRPDEAALAQRFGTTFPDLLKKKIFSELRVGQKTLEGAKKIYEKQLASAAPRTQPGRAAGGTFACPQCGQTFSSNMLLRQHVNSH